ncbi:MAG: DNA-methyltransferase [Ktedonobacteraceae bacterium]
MLLTDPPYGIAYESEHREVNPFAKIENDVLEDTITVLNTALALCEKKLKPDSHIYMFTSWKTYPVILPLVAKYFTVSDLLVWEKNNWTSGDLDANFGQIHELILFAQKGQKPLNGSPVPNLLTFSRVAENGRNHPTEKPLPLLEFLIEKSSNMGDMVCDPFAGVASTCVAAKNKGRQFLGIEISKEWYELGVTRLTDTL